MLTHSTPLTMILSGVEWVSMTPFVNFQTLSDVTPTWIAKYFSLPLINRLSFDCKDRGEILILWLVL